MCLVVCLLVMCLVICLAQTSVCGIQSKNFVLGLNLGFSLGQLRMKLKLDLQFLLVVSLALSYLVLSSIALSCVGLCCLVLSFAAVLSFVIWY
jgi:hypothetical protein